MTGGGTGGHVYPALSVVEAMREADPSRREQDPSRREAGPSRREQGPSRGDEVAWVGRADSLEQSIVAQEGLSFYPIAAGAMRGAKGLGIARSLGALAWGFWQARAVVARFRPDAVLATGGYVSVPLVLAAWMRGVPTLIYLPDMEPGWAVKALALLAKRVAVSFESVAAYFPRRKVLVCGYPVRRALWRTTRDAARRALGLDGALPILLVLGGSSGAHSLNEAVRRGLEPLVQVAQVIHVSGPEDYPRLQSLREALAEERRCRYHLFPYLHERMTDALVAADLVVARAGAATLGEFPAVGLPAVLVPYPYAGQHQQVNAAYLADRGAAVVVADGELSERFPSVVIELLAAGERLRGMGAAARALAVPDAAGRIAGELRALAGQRSAS